MQTRRESFTVLPPDVAFGALITDKTPELAFHKLIPGTYNQLRIQFLATDLTEIEIYKTLTLSLY